jgi:hypothetical protein
MKIYVEWKYNSAILDIGVRWILSGQLHTVAFFTPSKRAPDIH